MGTIFSAYDIRGRLGETLTTEYAWTVGRAFAEWLPTEGTIVLATSVGADAKTAHAVVEGILLQGRGVIGAGEGDEQAVKGTIIDTHAAGGVLIAHDDTQNIEIITLFDANGVTVTLEQGLDTIEELITAGNFVPAAEKGETITYSS